MTTTDGKHYRVGLAAEPLPEDPYCDTEAAALVRAQQIAEAIGWRTAVAVWDQDSEPLWVFMLGYRFKRA